MPETIIQPLLQFGAPSAQPWFSHAFPLTAVAQLRVEITGVGSQQFPISIANFARNGQAAPAEMDSIIRADLARSGLFRIVDAGSQATR